MKVFLVFAVKYLQLAACLWPETHSKDSGLKMWDRAVWPHHIFLRFVLDILDLLNSLLLPKKRNQKFFKGIERFYENQGGQLTPEILRSIYKKFYKKCFGSASLGQIHEIARSASLLEAGELALKIQKEEAVNYEEDCFDFVLDFDEFYARQRRTFASASFHRTNFHSYYLKFFTSKRGLQALMDFARGHSPYRSKFPRTPGPSLPRVIGAQYLLPILQLICSVTSELLKNARYRPQVNFDGNFVSASQLRESQNLLKKDSHISDSEQRVLHVVSCPTKAFCQETLAEAALLGLEFLSQFQLRETFVNDLDAVVEVLLFVEKIVQNVKSLSPSKAVLERLSEKAQGKKVNQKFFLQSLIDILKLYLENPNYTQKMSACDFLNNLPKQVPANPRNWRLSASSDCINSSSPATSCKACSANSTIRSSRRDCSLSTGACRDTSI